MSQASSPATEPPLYNEIHRFFDLSIDPLAILSNGRFVRLNPAWEKTLGYSIQELMSMSIMDLIHPDDVASTIAVRDQVQADDGALIQFQNRYRHKNGSFRWLEWTAQWYGADKVLYAVARDITARKEAEAELHQSREAMRGLLDGMPDLALMAKPDGTLLMLNQHQADLYGTTVEDAIGRSMYDFAPTEAMRQERQAWIKQIVSTREPIRREIQRDGRTGETYAKSIWNEQGEVVSFVIAGHDITHLKEIEAALRQSERTLRQLINGTEDSAYLIDVSGRIMMMNDSALSKFDMSEKELMGYLVYDLLPSEEAARNQASVERAIHTGQRQKYVTEINGSFREVSHNPIFDQHGQVTCIAIFVHNITGMKQIEAALRKSEQQFRSVLESAAEGILLTDEAGKIVLVNQAIEKQFGYSRDELIGQPLEVLLPEALREHHSQSRENYAQNPVPHPSRMGEDLSGRRKDGSQFPVEISLSYVENDELLMMALVVDITERKQIEQERIEHEKQRELIELRQRFISMISHEFRTPLSVIASSSEILSHYYDRLTHEQRIERVNSLTGHVQMMVGLLDDILMLNKIQAGMAELHLEPLGLIGICNYALDTAALIDQGQHYIQFATDHMPPTVLADRRALEHILTNLLSNAIKYSPPNTQITLQLSTAHDRVTFVVKDEGRGIPEADQARLFEPFHRASNVDEISGTGLGLAIVKSYVDMHRGSIRFESAEGKGTTFWVDIPTAPQGLFA